VGRRTLKLAMALVVFVLLSLSGLAYLLFLQFAFPTLVPNHGSEEKFSFGPGYTYQIPWHADGKLHLAFQASAEVKLYLDGDYVGECAGYEFTVKPGNDVLVQMTSDSAVTGMFTACQEPPLERQVLALVVLAAGLAGIAMSIWLMKKK
jgi:hypothetical protein